MKKGKRTCEILKDVRRKIAQENDIPLVERECTHEGDCRGTCPYCESEVRYLERELSKRRALGKAVTVAGIAVSTMMMGACHSPKTPATPAGSEPEPTPVNTLSQAAEPSPESSPEPVGEPVNTPANGNRPAPAPKGEILQIVEDGLCVSTDVPDFGEIDVTDDYEGFIETDDYYEKPPMLFVEEMPEFPGGMDSLYAFLAREIQYPPIAKDNGITGTVLVEFVVEEDGRVTNAKVKVPLFPECDKEAVRAVMSMPKWKPGKSMGKPVRCYYQVPVTFRL
ncbi:MAG: energy transducer TonB [Bacteroidales bacterium]|nr:energy transducer TonB [Bacteroidales bacterium]